MYSNINELEKNVFLLNNCESLLIHHRFPTNSHEVQEEIIEIHTENDNHSKIMKDSSGAEHLLCIRALKFIWHIKSFSAVKPPIKNCIIRKANTARS